MTGPVFLLVCQIGGSSSFSLRFFYLFLSDKRNLENASSTMRGRAWRDVSVPGAFGLYLVSRQHQASTGSLHPSRLLRRDRGGFRPT